MAESDARELLRETVPRLEHLRGPKLCALLKHSDYPCDCGHDDLCARITALLSAGGSDVVMVPSSEAKDAERFRKLQNMPVVDAQALFWNIKSRKQRAAAIDKLPAPPTSENGKEG